MVLSVILFIVGLVLICIGGDRLVDSAVVIAKKIGISEIVVGATIVSIGTTLPEILVSGAAAFDGSAAIAAGNAFGSIICNTALIAGLSQTIRPIKSISRFSLIWRFFIFLGMAAMLEIVSVSFGGVGRVIGIILLAGFVVYALLSIKLASKENEAEADNDSIQKAKEQSAIKHIIIMAICAVMLYFGANLLVDNGIIIAEAVGISERVIAVTFIALGTSLPELVTSMMSIRKGYANVGLGNIIGANLLNLLLVIGIPTTIAGSLPVGPSVYILDIPVGIAVMAVLVVPAIIRKKCSRIQGIILLGIYVGYCIISFAQNN